MKAKVRAKRPKIELSPRDQAREVFRSAILDAAERVFAEYGFFQARIQDIAQAAKIAVGTLYNHFEHKDEVLATLLDERMEAMLAQLRPQPGEPAEFAERIRVRIVRMLDYVEHHRGLFEIIARMGGVGGAVAMAGYEDRTVRCVTRFQETFRALIEEGVKSGALEPSLDTSHLAAFLGGTIRASTFDALRTSEPTEPLRERAAVIVDLFLYGAAKRSL